MMISIFCVSGHVKTMSSEELGLAPNNIGTSADSLHAKQKSASTVQ